MSNYKIGQPGYVLLHLPHWLKKAKKLNWSQIQEYTISLTAEIMHCKCVQVSPGTKYLIDHFKVIIPRKISAIMPAVDNLFVPSRSRDQ